ncbi:MAG: tetratricopeptide repeat protein [Kiritimatiellae bacterium]|nr:tetratricopeptide repeat protein [Kiritimatiellia bacterium]
MAEITEDQAPRKARELYEKAYAAMERGNLDYAIDMFLSALDLEPRFLKARRALRAAEIKKFKESKGGAATHVLSTVTGGLPMLLAMGKIKNNPFAALKAAEQLLRKDPLNKQFIQVLGKAAVSAEMPEVAIQTLEVAVEYYPKDADLFEWLGQLYIDTNQHQKGRECFEKIVEMRPNDPRAIKALKDVTALDTMQKGRWDTAESYRDVIKDEKAATLLEQDAKAVKTDRDVNSLIEETLRKIRQEPGNINYRRMLADHYVRMGRFDEALTTLQDTQKTTGGGDPQIDLAISAVQTRRFDAEIERLQAAGQAEAAAAKVKEREEFLLEDARDRVKRYPNDLQFRYDLGVALYERGILNDAIQQFQMAQRNPHRRIRSLYYLALCFKQKEHYDVAMDQLGKAAAEIYSMDETKKDIVYEMGQISEAMGQPDKAKGFYKEIYAVDIGYKDVAEKIDQTYKS